MPAAGDARRGPTANRPRSWQFRVRGRHHGWQAARCGRTRSHSVRGCRRNRDSTGTEDLAIVVLAADKAGDKDLAAAQLKTLIEKLGKGDRDLRRYSAILAGTTPFDADIVLSAVIDPELKRTLLPIFARDHKEAAPLARLAKKLNFQRDMISFCLNVVLENP